MSNRPAHWGKWAKDMGGEENLELYFALRCLKTRWWQVRLRWKRDRALALIYKEYPFLVAPTGLTFPR